MTDGFENYVLPLIYGRVATINDRLDYIADHVAAGDFNPREWTEEVVRLDREKIALEHLTDPLYDVTITRSAGADGAVVILIDGPQGSLAEGQNERDLRDDGAPACRVLLNDEAIYTGTPYAPAEEEPSE